MEKLRREFKISKEDFEKIGLIKKHLGFKTNSKTISKLINEFDFLKNKKEVKIILQTLFFENNEVSIPSLFLISKSVIPKLKKNNLDNIIIDFKNEGFVYEPRINILKRL